MTVVTTANLYYQVQTLVFFAEGFGHYSGFFEATCVYTSLVRRTRTRVKRFDAKERGYAYSLIQQGVKWSCCSATQ